MRCAMLVCVSHTPSRLFWPCWAEVLKGGEKDQDSTK